MSIADQALWIIERNSGQPLTLNGIAAACGVSRSHLANAFGTASGWPVMQYLKARRLTEAARKLADGAPDILSLALDSGYGSHEAFTRAFRDHFGVTPEQVRASRTLEALDLTAPLRLRSGRAQSPVPRFCRLDRLRFAGLSARYGYDAMIGIPAQWQRFMSEYGHGIPHRTARLPVGICRAPDDEGRFDYICAVEVTAPARRKGLTDLDIAPGSYAVFAHDDHVSTLSDTYGAIWNEALPASGRSMADGSVLEFHNETFDPATGHGGISIWVPLQEEE